MLLFYWLIISLFLLIIISNRFFYKIFLLLNSFILLIIICYYIMYFIWFDYHFNILYYYSFQLSFFFFSKNVTYFIVFDSLSLMLIFLTIILYIVCVLVIWELDYYFKLLNILLYLVVFFVILSFMTFDLFLFYIFFEAILIPMLLIIGIWGSRERKLTAAYRFFLYTLFGSIFFLTVVIYLFYYYGTTNIYVLYTIANFEKNIQILFWLFTFFAFAVKIPLFPFHTWLPEAHAEAPTIGSILLAGILLKLGPYGLFRFSNFLFPYGLVFFKPLIIILSLMGIYYTSLSAIRQLDLKKIIAYSSIGHMAFILIGFMLNTLETFFGSFILLLAHGFVSGGLFFMVGCIYDRYKTRIILYYNGLVMLNPKIAIFFFFFLLGNIAFPGTLNFLSELLIILGLIEFDFYLLFLIGFSSVFILAYNLFLFSKLFFFKPNINFIIYNKDLSIREFICAFILLFPVIFFGLFSFKFTSFIYKNILVLLCF